MLGGAWVVSVAWPFWEAATSGVCQNQRAISLSQTLQCGIHGVLLQKMNLELATESLWKLGVINLSV